MTRVLVFVPFFLLIGCPGTSSPSTDTGGLSDSAAGTDGGAALDAPGPTTDAPPVGDAPLVGDAPATTDDAGPMCGGASGMIEGWCDAGTSCECCPGGGPSQHCLCTTACTSAADCTDAARPTCEIPPGTTTGFCRPTALFCCWLCG
jgi:hypothetical protein